MILINTQAAHKPNKLLGLEVIRFISAFSILIWHYQYFFYTGDQPSTLAVENQPFYSIFSLFYQYGAWGVKVFWCISGFIFFYKYRSLIADKIVDAKKFFILRFSRLYPLHLLTFIAVALLQYHYVSHHGYYFVYQHNDIQHFLLQIFLASDWVVGVGNSFNGPIWSISVEVLVYFIFFITIKYIGSSAFVSIGVVTLCIGARFLKINSPLLECITFFYIGGLSAMAFEFFNETRYKNLLFILAALGVFLGPVVAYITNFYQHLYMFLFAYLPVLLYFSARKFHVHPRLQALIETAGNMTYSSYLIHFPIQLFIVIYFSYQDKSIPESSYTLFSIYITSSLLSSYYLYRYFEMPTQTYLRKNM